MTMLTLSTSVDLSLVKMKWQEQYVSEGLNHKSIPSMPRGIYRGMYLIPYSSSNLMVQVSSGSDGRHDAVSLDASGFGTSYVDNSGTSVILDLSGAATFETVVALYINYTVGASTTANWVAFKQVDWDALTAAQQGNYIVLGTVMMPASGLVTSAMILPKRRTVAWENAAPGSIAWSPIIKNPSFEHGISGADAFSYPISDWVNASPIGGNGSFRLGTTAVRSGAKSLEFNKTATGTVDASMIQYQEIPVIPGQMVHVTGWIKQLISPTAGSITFNLKWGTLESAAAGSTAITASVLSSTDLAFRKVDMIVAVPSAVYVLKTVTIEAVGFFTSASGIAVAIDDFQVYVETGSPQALASVVNARLKQQMVSALILDDPSGYSVTPPQIGALVRFDKSSPPGEGQIVFDRKDQTYNSSSLPFAIEHFGRVVNLGSGLISTTSDRDKARISSTYSSFSGAATLVWASSPDSGTGISTRVYTGNFGEIHTVNALYNNAGDTWTQDNFSLGSSMYFIRNTGFQQYFKPATGSATPFATSAWTTVNYTTGSETVTSSNQHFTPMSQFFDSAGNRRVAIDHFGFRGGRVIEYTQPWVSTTSPVATVSGWTNSNSTTYASPPAYVQYHPSDTTPAFYGVKLEALAVAGGTAYSTIGTAQPWVGFNGSSDCVVIMEWESYGNLSGTTVFNTFQGITNQTSGVWFYKNASVDNSWYFITGDLSTTTTTPTGVTVSAGANQRFRIEVYGSNTPGGARALGYINGILVSSSTTHLPFDNQQGMYFAINRTSSTALGGYVVVSSPTLRISRVLSEDNL